MYFFSPQPIALLLALLIITSCSTSPPIDVRDWSTGMNRQWLHVRDHHLLLLEKPAQDNQQQIHFYIEGDGTPWIKRYLVATDPSPRYPLALELMKRDPNLSFYLGRPCYYQAPEFYLTLHQPNSISPCSFHYWTDARYSANVVDIIKAAMQQTLAQLPAGKKSLPIILIGHSGGGTLAMLVAQRLEQVAGVITVAANMDTEAWTLKQGYSPLKNSLNLAREKNLRALPQVHFAGGRDEVVPAHINLPLMQKMGQTFNLIAGFDHNCCWLRDWPTLLTSAQQQLQQQGLKQDSLTP